MASQTLWERRRGWCDYLADGFTLLVLYYTFFLTLILINDFEWHWTDAQLDSREFVYSKYYKYWRIVGLAFKIAC